MIDINKLQQPEGTVSVKPCDRIFEELGNNTYDFKDLISELIDNAIAARHLDQKLNVEIEIEVDGKNKPFAITVRDNAVGISKERLGPAISPAEIHTINSLNEHGLGMKQAIAALGKLDYLATRTSEEDKCKVIRTFRFGDLDYFLTDFDQDSGTEIRVIEPRQIVNANPQSITMSLKPYLGARYRRLLAQDNKLMDLSISIKNVNTGNIMYNWGVEEVKPVYFHPSTRTNKPVMLKKKISGRGWKAELTFGYAPSDDEYKELGIEKPSNYDPYNVSLQKQGLDIIAHNRVVIFHQLSEIGIVQTKHSDYNQIRGEIDLVEGFSTAITKNSIINDDHFSQCIAAVKKMLTGAGEDDSRNYLRQKKYPAEIPEKLLRDRLANWLMNNPLDKKKDVKTEYTVGGLAGNIDILADGEAWEIKRDQADGLSVYQLFAYMDMGNFQKGFLVAASFATGATSAKDFINNKHKKQINLEKLKDFPINHSPSTEERENYY